jgi:hypothetical protein
MPPTPSYIRLLTVATVIAAISAFISFSTCGSAVASSRQLSVIEDSARVLSPNPAAQDTALDEIRNLDADIVKIPVLWRDVAPRGGSRNKPSGDLTNPATYGASAWATLDRAVLGARLRGLDVWLMLTAPAPRWAVARESVPGPGAFDPNPQDFADFAKAAGRHFASVRYWSIWNEPNLSRFLQPQYKNGIVVSAVHYRKMYRAGYDALTATGHAGDTILFGELLPRAPLPQRINATVPPLMWLREFFCLDKNLKALSGAEASRHQCNGYKPIKTSGFAYHPYTTPQGPLWNDPLPDNATIHHLGRVYKLLDAASRSRRLAARRLNIYSSEFGFQSKPPDGKMVPLAKIPEYLNISEFMSYHDPRMATYSQYLIKDDTALQSFQSGLRFSNGKPKPGVYDAYRLPLVVVARGPSSVLVWGKLRDGSADASSVQIQTNGGSGIHAIATLSVNHRTHSFEQVINNVNAVTDVFQAVSGSLKSRQTKAGLLPKMAP